AIWSTWANDAHRTSRAKTDAMTIRSRHAPGVTEDSIVARGSLAKSRSTSAIAAILFFGCQHAALLERRQDPVLRSVRHHAAVLEDDQAIHQLEHRHPMCREHERRVRFQPCAKPPDEGGLGQV